MPPNRVQPNPVHFCCVMMNRLIFNWWSSYPIETLIGHVKLIESTATVPLKLLIPIGEFSRLFLVCLLSFIGCALFK
jgi:hypothetical protein